MPPTTALEFKKISPESVDAALAKAELYRFLNDPEEAESICRDVLAAAPAHQLALRLLGLAITDQFSGKPSDRHADADGAFAQLSDPYEQLYYRGLLNERRAKAQLRAGRPPHTLLVLLEEAMRCYEQAEKLRPPDNDEAILRWNRCVRLMQAHESEWQREAGIEMGE
jgi:tetratricopeptide (TPR) repeat protein